MAKVLFFLCIPEEVETEDAKKKKKEEAKASSAAALSAAEAGSMLSRSSIGDSVLSVEKSLGSLLPQVPQLPVSVSVSVSSVKSDHPPHDPGASCGVEQLAAKDETRPDESLTFLTKDKEGKTKLPESLESSSPTAPQKQYASIPGIGLTACAQNSSLAKDSNEHKTVSQQPGPQTVSQQPGPPTVSQQPGPPTVSQQPGPPTVSQQPGPPIESQQSGPPTVSQQPGPPTESQIGPPAECLISAEDDFWDFETSKNDKEEVAKGTIENCPVEQQKQSAQMASQADQIKSNDLVGRKTEDQAESGFVTCPSTPMTESKSLNLEKEPILVAGKFTTQQVAEPDLNGLKEKLIDVLDEVHSEDKSTTQPLGENPNVKSSPRQSLVPSSSSPTDVTTTPAEQGSATLQEDESGHASDPTDATLSGSKQLEESQSSEGMFDFLPKTSLRKDVRECLEGMGVKNMAWQKCVGDKVWQVTFIEESGNRCEAIIQKLDHLGVGHLKQSSISVLPVTIFADDNSQLEESGDDEEEEQSEEKDKNKQMEEKKSDFQKSIKSRLVVQQVVKSVEANAGFTFDYVMLVILASMIAALGLVENSSIILVASMLISPLMGPILAGTFGIVIKNSYLRNLGVRSELYGLGLCLVCGFVIGLLPASLEAGSLPWRHSDEWPTTEMSSRGGARGLLVGIMIAIPSGAGVALSVLGGNTGSLVGVAISASLLPPAVNAEQTGNIVVFLNGTAQNQTQRTWILTMSESERGKACPYFQDNDYVHTYTCSTPLDLCLLGTFSLALTILNIICIFVMGVIVLKIKEVAPRATNLSQRTFFKTDLKVARESYTTTKGPQSAQLGKKWLEEYKRLMEEESGEGAEMGEENDTLEFQRILHVVEESPEVRDLLGRCGTRERPVSDQLTSVFDEAYSRIVQKYPQEAAYRTISNYLTMSSAVQSTVRPKNVRNALNLMSMFHNPADNYSTLQRLFSPASPQTPISSPSFEAIPEDGVVEFSSSTPVKTRGHKKLRLHMPKKFQVIRYAEKKPSDEGLTTETMPEDAKKATGTKAGGGKKGAQVMGGYKRRYTPSLKKKRGSKAEAASLLSGVREEELPMVATQPADQTQDVPDTVTVTKDL